MAQFKAASIKANEIGLHIAAHKEIYEPARSNCFDLIINDIDNLLTAGVKKEMATDADYILGAADVIRLSCENFPVPHYDLSTIEVRRVNSTIKFVGQPSWSSGSFKCTDEIGARTKDVLLALQAQAYDINTDTVHEAANYKHTWVVNEYNPDYTKVLRSWTLYGAWISKLSEDDFTHDNGDKRSITIEVQYDRAIPTIEAEENE